MVKRSNHPRHFFTKEEKQKISDAISEAEKGNTGDIVVFLGRRSRGGVLERAKKVFERYRLHYHRQRNVIFIYIALADHAFAILGDEGIHRHAGGAFWQELAGIMESHFRRHEFLEGLEHVIREAGAKLRQHFPAPAPCGELPKQGPKPDQVLE